MSQIIGVISIHPWLSIEVDAAFDKRIINFLFDTGFEGELAIPKEFMSMFGTSEDYLSADFANGRREKAMLVTCRIKWGDEDRDVSAMYINGENPLIGMELFSDCVVTLEIQNGQGDITVDF